MRGNDSVWNYLSNKASLSGLVQELGELHFQQANFEIFSTARFGFSRNWPKESKFCPKIIV